MTDLGQTTVNVEQRGQGPVTLEQMLQAAKHLPAPLRTPVVITTYAIWDRICKYCDQQNPAVPAAALDDDPRQAQLYGVRVEKYPDKYRAQSAAYLAYRQNKDVTLIT